MAIQLYTFGESDNYYKVSRPLELSGLPWTLRKVDFFGGATQTADYKTNVNEMGEAPVLINADLKLTQSGVIQDYIAEKSGEFYGADVAERREILRWMLWDNHKLSSIAGATRFLMNFLPEDRRPAEIIPFNQGRLNGAPMRC